EPRRLERYAHIPQRAIRVSDHGPLHRRWVANRTADATSICPQIARSPRQSDPPDAQNPQKLAETCRGAGYAQLPSPTQNWQHCTDVCKRPDGARGEERRAPPPITIAPYYIASSHTVAIYGCAAGPRGPRLVFTPLFNTGFD